MRRQPYTQRRHGHADDLHDAQTFAEQHERLERGERRHQIDQRRHPRNFPTPEHQEQQCYRCQGNDKYRPGERGKERRHRSDRC